MITAVWMVGVSRESVNKQLGEWQRGGLIDIAGGIITLRDRRAIEGIASANG